MTVHLRGLEDFQRIDFGSVGLHSSELEMGVINACTQTLNAA